MIGAQRSSGDDTSFAASRNEAEVRALAVVPMSLLMATCCPAGQMRDWGYR